MKANQANIKIAKKYLNKDMCIAIPTETVYGLAANAYSDIAVKKIFKLKKRPKTNPLIVHYSNISKLKEDCLIDQNFLKLFKRFSPGPLTYVLCLRKDSRISKIVTNNKKTLAVRFPKHILLRKLLNILDYPLAAPSANISTRLSAVSAIDVKNDFENKIAYILDGGKSKIGLESTIIDLTKTPKILRLGGIEVTKIKDLLKKDVKLDVNPSKKKVPGQNKLHYSPGIPLRMNVIRPKNNEAFILIKKRKYESKNCYYLSKKNDLKEAAKNLYSCLRQIKNKGYKSVAVEKISNIGLGKTINDRLIRASRFK
jgi:L-threonylcarbamoyladenylate synthase